MIKTTRFVFASLFMAAAAAFTGCGQAASPPPGAPDKAEAPQINQGEETAPAADQSSASVTQPVFEVRTAAADGDWGTLKGRIVFDGKAPAPAPVDTSKDAACKTPLTTENLLVSPDGGIQNAVIMLRTKNPKVHPDYEKTASDEVVLDNKNCRFEPHVQVVRLSQTLMLKNSDPTGHNSNITPILGTPINPVLAAGGEPVPYKFTAEEAIPVKVGCNIHPWMGAYVVARKDPYAAVTDKDGNFVIENLPAGKELEFRLWQENAGYLKNAAFKGGKADARGTFKLKIKPGDNNLGDIKVPASVFKK